MEVNTSIVIVIRAKKHCPFTRGSSASTSDTTLQPFPPQVGMHAISDQANPIQDSEVSSTVHCQGSGWLHSLAVSIMNVFCITSLNRVPCHSICYYEDYHGYEYFPSSAPRMYLQSPSASCNQKRDQSTRDEYGLCHEQGASLSLQFHIPHPKDLH